jgi:pimeloyl-ACP methyl ester carboxylesterase
MLHEGLGCITQWSDIPDRLHDTTGLPVVIYDRSGYGRSSSGPSSYGPDFMYEEANHTLPDLLDLLAIKEPVLVGHSDGGTIGLLAAASGRVPATAVITIAAHIFVEQVCLNGVREITRRRGQMLAGMARHHNAPAATFDRWSDVWLDPEFAKFDMRGQLSKIKCPLLVLQGDRDEYATVEMIHGITRRVPHVIGRFIAECGHIAHRDQPELVVAELTNFLNDILQ